MHRLRSIATVRRFRIAAFLVCAKCLLAPIAGGILIHSILTNDRDRTLIGLAAIAVTILTILLQWLFAARTNCPLCLTPVLANKHCSKHPKAKSLFGSHRLRVATSILLKNRLRCPYCNEATAMEVRDKSRTRSNSRG